MSTLQSIPRPIDVVTGVDTDSTPISTQHYIWSKGIRFVNGLPEKIGGWTRRRFADGVNADGVVRSIYSRYFGGVARYIVGTHTRLYTFRGSELVNITPFQDDAVPAPDSMETLYGSLSNDPISTTAGSNNVWFSDASASRFRVGDSVSISGAVDTGGVPAGDLNQVFVVRNISANAFMVRVSTPATSTVTGGGSGVVRATSIIRLDTVNELREGDRVSISGASGFASIADAEINREHIIRNVDASGFDIYVGSIADSFVTADGGSDTEYLIPIPSGTRDEAFAQGYGVGLYGVGMYGDVKTSQTGRNYVQIWFTDHYGDNIVTTAGNGSPVYIWNGDTANAPIKVENAPEDVNYAFISDNVLVTFGAGATPNRIFASDQGQITQWTASSLNQVYENSIAVAGRLVSHVSVPANNLIFTETSCYTFRKIHRDAGVWEIKIKDPSIGIIAPMARVSVGGVAYWMGQNNFYMWRGGNVEVIPSNNPVIRQSTILEHVFGDINRGQASKFFAWHNRIFDEIWFHYCSEDSNEPNKIARLSLRDFSWCPDEMDRTAAEYPIQVLQYPVTSEVSNGTTLIYDQERGFDADGLPLSFELVSSDRSYQSARGNWGKLNGYITGIIPDSRQEGVVNFRIQSRQWPQSTALVYDTTMPISNDTERFEITNAGRVWRYTWSGNELGQHWKLGQWFEEIKGASPE